MPCDFNFVDTASVSWQISGSTISATAAGSGTGGCCNTLLNLTYDPVSGLLTAAVTDDNGTVQDSVSLPTSTGGTGNTSSLSSVPNPDGSFTYTHNNGAGVTQQFTVPPPPCSVAGGGITGTQSGVFIDACQTLPIADNTSFNYPESEYPAAGFPPYWRQIFTNGVTGQDEEWIVLADTNGVLQWHQRA